MLQWNQLHADILETGLEGILPGAPFAFIVMHKKLRDFVAL